MYKYNDIDKRIVHARVEEFRDQVRRRLAGELAEEDFLGGAFLTGTLSHGSGLASGFDYYFEALVGHELVDTHSPWSEFRSGLLPWLYKNKLRLKNKGWTMIEHIRGHTVAPSEHKER